MKPPPSFFPLNPESSLFLSRTHFLYRLFFFKQKNLRCALKPGGSSVHRSLLCVAILDNPQPLGLAPFRSHLEKHPAKGLNIQPSNKAPASLPESQRTERLGGVGMINDGRSNCLNQPFFVPTKYASGGVK